MRRIFFDLDSVSQIFIGGGQHKFNTVDLVDLAGARIVVDGYDIGARICISKFFNNAFSNNMVRQTAKWLRADNIAGSLMNQFNHFTGQKPSFTSLIAD